MKIEHGSVYIEPTTKIEMVRIIGKNFKMGNKKSNEQDDNYVHIVSLDDFWISRYLVTQKVWKTIMKDNPSNFIDDKNPVDSVSWNIAKEFTNILTKMNESKYIFRLPTEAEWEFASRSGGFDEIYPGNYDLNYVGWYVDNSNGTTHNVGLLAPNGLGLYDMCGNVWEWCEDTYDPAAYHHHEHENPLFFTGGVYKVIRGGSFDDEKENISCTFRAYHPMYYGYKNIGFRIVMIENKGQ